jgi:hypothetical protein
MPQNEANQIALMHAAPRCHAKAKRTGKRCGCAAMRGKKVCYLHGGRAGAPSGKANGSYKTGEHTKEAIALRKLGTQMMRDLRETL